MKVGIAGAGSIGCYVGGMLAAGGHQVALLGRAGVCAQIAADGLKLTDNDGGAYRAAGLACGTEAEVLKAGEVVLVCVKSRDTDAIAAQIAPHLAPGAIVISLQNGVRNADLLRAALPGVDVRGGMVPFNVISDTPGHYHRGTDGNILIEARGDGLDDRLSVPGLLIEARDDFESVLWGKLLVNLNNALNALSGLPLKQQLMDRNWRRVLAAQMTETLRVLDAMAVVPERFTDAPVRLIPWILRLPTPVFRRIAERMLTIDKHARSSMQDDLTAGRPTEIDALQGEVLARAQAVGLDCPVIARVVAAVRAAEAAGKGPPGRDAATLLQG